jgi:hypothetical protein
MSRTPFVYYLLMLSAATVLLGANSCGNALEASIVALLRP